jgi:hypothetical protein
MKDLRGIEHFHGLSVIHPHMQTPMEHQSREKWLHKHHLSPARNGEVTNPRNNASGMRILCPSLTLSQQIDLFLSENCLRVQHETAITMSLGPEKKLRTRCRHENDGLANPGGSENRRVID